MNQNNRSEENFFRRLKRRSSRFFLLFLLAITLQFAVQLYVSWRNGQMLELRGLLSSQKSELEVVGRSIQEIVLLRGNGPTSSRLLESNKLIIRAKTSDIRSRDMIIDRLISDMPSETSELIAIADIRSKYSAISKLFLERADNISSDRDFITNDFLTLTDLIIAPNGIMLSSFDEINQELLNYGVYLQRLGLFGHAAVGLFLIAFVSILIFVFFWRLVDRASKDYRQLVNSVNVRTRYFYQMSHELRTPLNAIIGYSELLSSMLKGPSHKSYAENIQEAGQKLSGHIENIIVLSQLNSNSYEVKRQSCNLSGIVQSLLRQTNRSDITLDLDISTLPEDGLAFCDGEAFSKIFKEIFTNAMTHASASVRVSIKEQSGLRTVEIADDGPGIDEAEFARICEPFQTVSNAYSTADNGPGIGLTVAHLLAGLSNIKMEFSHNRPRGLIVRLSVPLTEAASQNSSFFNELTPQFIRLQE